MITYNNITISSYNPRYTTSFPLFLHFPIARIAIANSFFLFRMTPLHPPLPLGKKTCTDPRSETRVMFSPSRKKAVDGGQQARRPRIPGSRG